MAKVTRLKKLHGIAEDVRAMAVIASEIVAMDKAELVAKVDDKHEHFGPFLMQLARAGGQRPESARWRGLVRVPYPPARQSSNPARGAAAALSRDKHDDDPHPYSPKLKQRA